MTRPSNTRTGIVVIGRNLGSRLAACLRSVIARGGPVVYVDSASTDGSERAAPDLGVEIVRLDERDPLSASRGRNAGAASLLRHHPEVRYVQFVDGDCELDPAWIPAAEAELDGEPRLGVVCGVVREKFADRSVAATLLDIDWQGPVGPIDACGGIFVARSAAFVESGGFSERLAAGEEAEFCARLRARGWHIRRVPRPMCAHDADIHTLRGWWRRAVRVGHGDAVATRMTGPSRDAAARHRVRRTVFWTLVLPGLAAAGAVTAAWQPQALVIPIGVLALYAAQVLRMAIRQRRDGRPWRHALLYAVFSLSAKWAHLLGCLRYLAGR